MKKLLIASSIALSIGLLAGCSDTSTNEGTQENKTAETAQEKTSANRQEEIQNETENVLKKVDDASIKEIKVNENMGTDNPDDYIVLIYLKYETNNSGKMAKKMIDMYNNEIGAKLAKQKDIEEITVFWEVPHLLEGNNAAKVNLKRDGNDMVFESEWFDSVMQ